MTVATKKLSFVIPALNEEKNLQRTSEVLISHVKELGYCYQIVFVDDGSTDSSLQILRQLHRKDPGIQFVSLSKNMGEQKALKAGLDHVNGDAVITMDADLQHPPRYLKQMVNAWQSGSEIVIMCRSEAGHSNFLLKVAEIFFYKIMRFISQTDFHYRFSGFCLLDQKPLLALQSYKEQDPFFRAIIADLGFSKTEIEYKEDVRTLGSTNYNFLKLLKIALSGLTSHSILPLYVSFYTGLISVLLSLLYVLRSLYIFFFYGIPVEGWMSTMTIIVFLGGVQLMSTGVLGLYIGKSFMYLKNRPLYVVKDSSIC